MGQLKFQCSREFQILKQICPAQVAWIMAAATAGVDVQQQDTWRMHLQQVMRDRPAAHVPAKWLLTVRLLMMPAPTIACYMSVQHSTLCV